MADLIPPPDLDIRDDEQLAAEAIARTSGGLTVARIDSDLETLRKLRILVNGGALDPAICPELVNANPSSPHTVILEAQAWIAAHIARRINRLPERDAIEFHRLFGIELREAAPATATVEFQLGPAAPVDVTIPQGTQVATEDGAYVFATNEEIEIEATQAVFSGSVTATRTVAGETLLAPNVLTRILDAIAWVDSATNPDSVASGGNDETVAEALQRARNYQRRGERLVSTRDIEDAIIEEALLNNGLVKAFPFVRAGDFTVSLPGHTTVVVMTELGDPVSGEIKQAINMLLDQLVGNQFVYVLDPIYIEFDVSADVLAVAGKTQSAVETAIETALRAFYAPALKNFGRGIRRSEVITVIEGTPDSRSHNQSAFRRDPGAAGSRYETGSLGTA